MFLKSIQNPFLLYPWSVKLAVRKFSAAGPYNRFFPLSPPHGIFIHPLVPQRKQKQYEGPAAEYLLMADFTLHGYSRKGF